MRNLVVISLLAALNVGSSVVYAQETQLALTPVFSRSGNTTRVVFHGSLRNTTKRPLFVNQLSVSFRENAPLDIDPSGCYTHFQGAIAAGASRIDKPVFEVSMPGAAPTSLFHGTLTLLGGASRNAANRIAQQDFLVRFSSGGAVSFTVAKVKRDGLKALTVTLQGASEDAAEAATLTGVSIDGAARETVDLASPFPLLKSQQTCDLPVHFVQALPPNAQEITFILTSGGTSRTVKARIEAAP